MRGKDYQILKRAEIQARLKLPPDQQLTHPESGVVRALDDCPDLPLGPQGMRCRLVVATHPASERKSRVGVTRKASRLRTLLDQLTSGRFYRRRYRRALFASRRGRSMPEPPRTRSKTPTAGGVMPLAARSAGKSSLNGCGTCAWNWAISFILIRYARPRLLLHTSASLKRRLPRLLPHRGMGQQKWPCAGRAGRFSGRDFALQPDGSLRFGCRAVACGALAAHRSRRAPARGLCGHHPQLSPLSCAGAVSMAWYRRHQASSGECAVASPRRRFGAPARGGTGAGDSIDGPACNCCAINASRYTSSLPALPPLAARRLPCPGRSGRILAFRGQIGWRGPARIPTAGPVTIRRFGGTFGFATSLGLATA